MITEIQARLAEIYGEDSYYAKSYMPWELQYSGHIQDWLKKALPPLGVFARILDIGPGYGTLAAYCHKLTGASVYTVDRLLRIYPKIEAEYGLLCGIVDVERQDLPIDDLDVVIMTEVLEHFNFRPTPTLTKIRHAMRPGGLLFLSTPDADSKWGKINKYSELGRIPTFDPEHDSYDKPAWKDEHVWQYTEDELRSVLYYSGFKIIQGAYSHSPGGRHFNVMAQA